MQSCQPFCQWRCPCPPHITWNLHPSLVDAPVDIYGKSHSFPFIHPREVFLAWHWVITRPSSSCGIVLLSLPLGVGLTEVELVHLSHTWQTPTHKEAPASDATRRSRLQCRMCEFSCWSFTSYEGTSVIIWCTTSWGLSSYLSLIFFFPWKVSALTKLRSPGFKASAVDLAWASWRAVFKRSLTMASCSSTCWESKSRLGALAFAQTLSNVGCIPSLQIGWHYRHAPFQPDDLASWLFHLPQAS